MTSLSTIEAATLERAAEAPMLAQVERWAAVNSGTGNLAGLQTVAGLLADAFAVLPGDIRLVAPDPVESVDAAGRVQTIERGPHLHLRVRHAAPVQLLLTGQAPQSGGEGQTVYVRVDPGGSRILKKKKKQ